MIVHKAIRSLLRRFKGKGMATPNIKIGCKRDGIKIAKDGTTTINITATSWKPREWQTHHRILVVDQGGRVIGYRYISGNEK